MDSTACNPGKRRLEVENDTGDSVTPKRSKNAGHHESVTSQLPDATVDIPHIPGFEDFELIDPTEEAYRPVLPVVEHGHSVQQRSRAGPRYAMSTSSALGQGAPGGSITHDTASSYPPARRASWDTFDLLSMNQDDMTQPQEPLQPANGSSTLPQPRSNSTPNIFLPLNKESTQELGFAQPELAVSGPGPAVVPSLESDKDKNPVEAIREAIGNEEGELSQPISRATTPELSPAASSYDTTSTQGENTPASVEDQDDVYVLQRSIFTPSEGLLRALESKHLPDDFLGRFRAKYPGLLNDFTTASDDAPQNEESTSEDGPASRRLRRSRIEFNKPPFPCPSGCLTLFDEVSAFREHLQSIHSVEFTLCKHEDCVKFVPVDPETKMVLVWHYKQDHGQHIIQCTEHPNCSFRPNFDAKRSVDHIRSHRLRCHQCLDEKKRALPFGTADALKAHIKVQHSAASFPCQGYDFAKGKPCDRRFPTEGGRTKHMGCAHKGQFLCPFCPLDSGKVEMHKSDKALALHVRHEHEDEYTGEWAAKAGEKIFTCPHCEKGMSKNSNLQKHIASFHAREKPFKCCATDVSASPRMVEDDGATLHWDPQKSGCDNAFANKQTLIDHVRSAHFGLLRWEALKKLKSGETITLVGTRKEKKSKKAKVPATSVLSGVHTDTSE